MLQPKVIFAVSLKKKNADKERAILIKAGLLTSAQSNNYAYLIKNYPWHLGWKLTLQDSYKTSTYRPFLIVTAKQFVQLYHLSQLIPNCEATTLLDSIKLTARNKSVLLWGDAISKQYYANRYLKDAA